MPAPYSYDFRKKAIEAFKRGERKVNICRLLNISRNTLDLWLKREAETGDFQAKTATHKGPKPKIHDREKFRAFIIEHGSKTQKKMALLWGEE
ncbi:MAG: helix-turn-helix domain-containing protein [Oscillatoria sp. SIO1A7]|nr:helix-turn-helix domain-containing protein [Oscillatoria sp. SIO1A7]